MGRVGQQECVRWKSRQGRGWAFRASCVGARSPAQPGAWLKMDPGPQRGVEACGIWTNSTPSKGRWRCTTGDFRRLRASRLQASVLDLCSECLGPILGCVFASDWGRRMTPGLLESRRATGPGRSPGPAICQRFAAAEALMWKRCPNLFYAALAGGAARLEPSHHACACSWGMHVLILVCVDDVWIATTLQKHTTCSTPNKFGALAHWRGTA